MAKQTLLVESYVYNNLVKGLRDSISQTDLYFMYGKENSGVGAFYRLIDSMVSKYDLVDLIPKRGHYNVPPLLMTKARWEASGKEYKKLYTVS